MQVFILKEKLLKYLIKEKYDVKDFGCSTEEIVDYPDFGHPLANAVSAGEFDLGHINMRNRKWNKHDSKQTSGNKKRFMLE